MKEIFQILSKRFEMASAGCMALLLMGSVFLLSNPIGMNQLAVDVGDTAEYIAGSCPSLSVEAIRTALVAYNHATAMGVVLKPVLTVIDYTAPSNQKRLCSVNLLTKDILYNGYVEHGARSGGLYATKFSNQNDSHETSLGLFRTGSPYYGVAGYSLHLDGLDKGLNDQAAARHVVMHGTPRATDTYVNSHNGAGHTLGCFGINKNHVKEVINELKEGSLIFAYYPSSQLQTSQFLS